jgi:hypothetical protein
MGATGADNHILSIISLLIFGFRLDRLLVRQHFFAPLCSVQASASTQLIFIVLLSSITGRTKLCISQLRQCQTLYRILFWQWFSKIGISNSGTFIKIAINLRLSVIAKKILLNFWEKHQDSDQLKAWYNEAEYAAWKKPNEIKREYPTASILAEFFNTQQYTIWYCVRFI